MIIDLKSTRDELLARLGFLAAKRICLFRKIRMHRLCLRADAIQKALKG